MNARESTTNCKCRRARELILLFSLLKKCNEHHRQLGTVLQCGSVWKCMLCPWRLFGVRDRSGFSKLSVSLLSALLTLRCHSNGSRCFANQQYAAASVDFQSCFVCRFCRAIGVLCHNCALGVCTPLSLASLWAKDSQCTH